MPHRFSRTDRYADMIQREIAELVIRTVKDPRLKMLSVSAVRMSSDLSHAKIFVTFIDSEDEEQVKSRMSALSKASGFLRHKLSKRLEIRSIPDLKFYYDVDLKQAERLSDLIDKTVPPSNGAE